MVRTQRIETLHRERAQPHADAATPRRQAPRDLRRRHQRQARREGPAADRRPDEDRPRARVPTNNDARHAERPQAKDKGYNNAGGGVYNHDLFWKALAPAGKGGAPSKALAAAIDKKFGSLDKLKEEWAALGAPASTFGSGWVWLIVQGKDLAICNSPNQDNPLMKGAATEGIPILGLDVWEHAYYLKYQNRRPEYVAAFWDIVNWNQVNEWYDDALAGKAPQF